MRWLIVLGGMVLLWSLLTAPAFAGLADFKTTVKIKDGFQFAGFVDWTQGGVVIETEHFKYVNTTGSDVEKTFTSSAPSDADNMEEHSKGKKIPATSDKSSDLKLPSVSPDTLATYLADNGYTNFASKSFDMPFAVGDSSGSYSDSSVSLYAEITNLSAYQPYASQTNFPNGSVFTTNSNGSIPGVPGLEFFTDPSFTSGTKYANSSISIVGITSLQATPEPSGIVLAGTALAGLSVTLLRRRKHLGSATPTL